LGQELKPEMYQQPIIKNFPEQQLASTPYLESEIPVVNHSTDID
jgi:hypothetical protein